ncbi:MAG: hypothetical protein JJT82_06575 [Legionellaceae bacterium]|nr:hypothetical protein [Legionellaceae bacterium]
MRLTVLMESHLEPHFLNDSYGYRPHKSALDAIGVTRKGCWQYDWVVEFDIKGLFDNLSHELLMKAVKHHISDKWILLYVERWLTAPIQDSQGAYQPRTAGRPQGGVISPLLSNLFLHYAFDHWMTKHHRGTPWCRYADDGLAHCRTQKEAENIEISHSTFWATRSKQDKSRSNRETVSSLASYQWYHSRL